MGLQVGGVQLAAERVQYKGLQLSTVAIKSEEICLASGSGPQEPFSIEAELSMASEALSQSLSSPLLRPVLRSILVISAKHLSFLTCFSRREVPYDLANKSRHKTFTVVYNLV